MERYRWSPNPGLERDDLGPLVFYDDAQRAVAEAEQRGRSEAANDIDTVAYLLGRRDALAAAVGRVESQAAWWKEDTLIRLGIGIALAAIKKEQP